MSSNSIGIRVQNGRYGVMLEAYPESAARERSPDAPLIPTPVPSKPCRNGVIGSGRRSGSNPGANETSRSFNSSSASQR